MHKQRGFTFIEVLIVLVIAGLMMLVVFMAVPAARRSAHNNVRHKDTALLLAAVTEFRSQSPSGALPDSCNSAQDGCFAKNTPRGYYQDTDAAPAVTYVKLNHEYSDADALLQADDDDVTEKVVMYSYAICNDSGTMPTGQFASPQDVAVQYAIETFSGAALQCKQI